MTRYGLLEAQMQLLSSHQQPYSIVFSLELLL